MRAQKVPAGDSKKDLLDQLDKVPTYVQTLQFTVKEPTVGKAATFVKVDHVIRETKNLMNVINKVVTTCFECANKVSPHDEIAITVHFIQDPTAKRTSKVSQTCETHKYGKLVSLGGFGKLIPGALDIFFHIYTFTYIITYSFFHHSQPRQTDFN